MVPIGTNPILSEVIVFVLVVSTSIPVMFFPEDFELFLHQPQEAIWGESIAVEEESMLCSELLLLLLLFCYLVVCRKIVNNTMHRIASFILFFFHTCY